MKKFLLLFLAVICVILLKAQGKSSPAHTVTLNGVYEKIWVGENIKVVLSEGVPGTVSVKGNQEAEVSVQDGVLFVKKRPGFKSSSVTVHIPVREIKSIELNGGSAAYSDGQLQSDNLTVFVNGATYFELKSKGMIKVIYPEELELDVKKVRNEKLLQVVTMK